MRFLQSFHGSVEKGRFSAFFRSSLKQKKKEGLSEMVISVTFNFNFFNFPTGAGAPQLCRRARTPRKRACATLGAF
jgi:hypothetical protein